MLSFMRIIHRLCFCKEEMPCLWFYAYQSLSCPPQRRKSICKIGWGVWFGQHFRRYREFMSLDFCMLLLCYHYVIVYAVFTRIMLLQRSDIMWSVLCFSVSFIPTQRIKRIRGIVWEIWFGQHFRSYREFMSLNFLMLLL